MCNTVYFCNTLNTLPEELTFMIGCLMLKETMCFYATSYRLLPWAKAITQPHLPYGSHSYHFLEPKQ